MSAPLRNLQQRFQIATNGLQQDRGALGEGRGDGDADRTLHVARQVDVWCLEAIDLGTPDGRWALGEYAASLALKGAR